MRHSTPSVTSTIFRARMSEARSMMPSDKLKPKAKSSRSPGEAEHHRARCVRL